MDNETDVLAVHAIPVIVQEEDIVCPTPNCHEGQNGVGLTLNNDRPLTGSRPSSQLSQNGSSGYGSTRSQVGPFGTSNRPSPASSSSSSSSSTNSNSTKTANNNTNSKPKRSVWFGGSKGSSLARAQRATSAEPETETVMSEPEVTSASSKTRGGPQYASLRIPNRIRPHGGSHGELSSFEDRGLDLAEAEVDSDVEVEVERGPMPAPRGHNPLRHANSLEAQVRFFFSFYVLDKANQYQF